PQDFIVYPMQKASKEILIQSDTRIGKLNLETGKGQMSQSHASGAYQPHLMMDKLIEFEISPLDAQSLRMQIFTTSGKEVGDYIKSSNIGASDILEDGGIAGDSQSEFERQKELYPGIENDESNPTCICFSAFVKKEHPELVEKIQETDINESPELRSEMDEAYQAYNGGKIK